MALWRRETRLGETPLAGRELILADLDGVVYRGANAIPGAVEALNNAGLPIGYVTNNASRTDSEVAAQLSALGLRVAADEIVTSPQAAVQLLRAVVEPGATVLVVGGLGLTAVLEEAGYRVTRSAEDDPAAVVQGFHPSVGWEDLAEACFALAERPGRAELPWIATNTDWTIPVARGEPAGNGTLVSAVHTEVQRLPVFAGKPETPIFEAAFERFGTRNALMIGDRLDTDIQGAVAAGIPSLHVLTGVDRPKQLLAAGHDMRPDYVLASLSELAEPYPETVLGRDGSHRVGDARVAMNGHVVRVVAEGSSPLNLLRAGCAAIWASGLAIYGLEVPDVLLIDHWNGGGAAKGG